MGFFARIRSTLSHPVFPDEERTSVARLLNFIALSALALMVPSAVSTWIATPSAIFFIPLGGFALVNGAILLLIRRGFTRPASVLFVVAGCLLAAFFTLFFGGLSSPGYTSFIVEILIAGLLLGVRAGIAVAVASSLFGAAIITASVNGMLPSIPASPIFAIITLVSDALIFIGALVVLHLAVRSIQESLQRSRLQESALREANRELQSLRDSLEERVRQRTRSLEESNARLDGAYHQLKENQERLLVSEKMASLGRLTAGIAHEINTPLAAVRAALFQLDTLAEEYQGSIGKAEITEKEHREIAVEMRQSILRANTAAERAASFVRSIKNRTRVMADEENIRFNAVPVIQEALLLLSHAMLRSGCTARFHPAASFIEVNGSPARLSQAVANLVTNSIDACASKGGGEITLTMARRDRGVRLEIRDTGIGIAPENLSRIFDPLFTTKPFGQGTGLGLTIVHQIVVGEFGGTIEPAAQPGGGTLFTITLPGA
jgi:signal transduction histidine kinase